MKNKLVKNIVLVILFGVLLYSSGGVYYNVYFCKKNKNNTIQSVDTIKNYNYTLKSNATDLYKTEFKTLKTNLESDNINEEEYAKSIAKLFVIDLYTISNKNNKYDVGGTEFVYPDGVSNYKTNVEDTIYKYVEDNSSNKRTQELPLVSSIEITTLESNNYKIGDKSFDGYKINLSWSYEKDLGYDTKGEIIVIKSDKYYYVVEKN